VLDVYRETMIKQHANIKPNFPLSRPVKTDCNSCK
jgi:hypothetical protein